MRGLNSAQYVWQCVYSIVHFAKFGRDPKRLQHQYFPGTDGEKKKKNGHKDARVFMATRQQKKMARISRRQCQELRPIFIYLFHSKVAFQLVRNQGGGGNISKKSTKPNPQNIYDGINNLESPQSNKPGLDQPLCQWLLTVLPMKNTDMCFFFSFFCVRTWHQEWNAVDCMSRADVRARQLCYNTSLPLAAHFNDIIFPTPALIFHIPTLHSTCYL